MKVLRSISLSHRVWVSVAVLAMAVALIVGVTLNQLPRASAQMAAQPGEVVSDSGFTSGADTLSIAAGTARIISGPLDFGGGDDTILNGGTLTIRPDAAVTGLEQFTQTSASTTLKFEIAADPEDGPVLDLGSANVNISDGGIQIDYTGDWTPDDNETFTLFSTSGTIEVSDPVQITDTDDSTSFNYFGSADNSQAVNEYTVLALMPPTIDATMVDRRRALGDSLEINIDAGNFFDSAGTLSYSATSQNDSIATVVVNGNTLTATGVAVGTTTITITATDAAMGQESQTFNFTVIPPTLTPDLDAGSDSGTSDNDGITNNTTLTITGSNALPSAGSVVVTARNVSPIIDTYPIGETVDGNLYPLDPSNIRITSILVTVGSPPSRIERHVPTSHLFGQTVQGDNLVLDGIDNVGGQRGTFRISNGRTIVVQNDNDGELTATATLSDNVTSQTIIINTRARTLADGESTTTVVTGAVRLLESVEESVTPNSDGSYSANLTFNTQGLWEVTAVQISSGLTSVRSPIALITLDTALPLEGTIDPQTIAAGGSTVTDVAPFFSDEGDLTYSAASNGESVATIALVGSSLTVNAVASGMANITVTATDAAGNQAEQSFAVTVFNLVAPSTPDLTDGSNSGAKDDTVTNSQSIQVTTQATAGRTVLFTASLMGSGDVVTAAVVADPSASVQLNLSEGVWTINAAETADGATGPASDDLQVTIDRTQPETEGTISDLTATTGDVDTVLSNPGQYFNSSDPDYDDFVFTVGSSDTTVATVTFDATEDEITIEVGEEGTTVITVTATDPAGNGTPQTFNFRVSPSALGPPDLVDADDSGVANDDNITNQNQLEFTGGGAEPGVQVTVTGTPPSSSSSSVTGNATSRADGTYSATLTLPQTAAGEGVWEITATQVVAGQTSAPSDPLEVTYDRTSPGQASARPTLGTLHLNGSRQLEDVTRFFFSRTMEPFSYTATVATRTTGNQTAVSLDSSSQDLTVTAGNTAGRADVEITATDVAGNTTTRTATVTVVLGLPDLHEDDDSGAFNDDNITNQTDEPLRISGIGAIASTEVEIRYADGSNTTTVSTQSDSSGGYGRELDLDPGTWFIAFIQVLEGGTRLPLSPTLTVTVDTTDPIISGETLGSSDRNFANENDVLFLTFDANEALGMTPTVTIGGQPADVSNAGLRYTATRTVNGSEAQGPVTHVISDIADVAGNTATVMTVTSGTIHIDTLAPVFQTDPAPSTENGRVIGNNEREATNIINVGNTHANDLIAFAVQPSSANETCDANFGTFTPNPATQGAQFDAARLLNLAEGSHDVCVRLTDRAGNAPDGVFASTSITRNFVSPSVSGTFSDEILMLVTGETRTFDNSSGTYFEDTSNDTLKITAVSSNPGVVSVRGSDDDSFTLEAVAVFPDGEDPVTITVTATDTADQTAEQRFEVTVTSEFDIAFPEPPDNSPIEHFVVAEVAEDDPDRPTPPRDVRFPAALYDITPRDSAGAVLEGVAAEVCLSTEGLARLGSLSVYHFDDGVWVALPSYISESGAHICAETESFSIFALGFVVERTLGAGLLPPTGGITPNIWIIAAAATAGSMTLVAGAALGLTALLSRRTTRKSSLQEQRPIT